jgi:hypothetical protein
MKTLFSGLLVAVLAAPVSVVAAELPDPESVEFCQVAQQILANTEIVGENEIFTDMPSYRHSKPSPDPLKIYQVVSYVGAVPIVVSCKLKAADHLQEVFGEAAAGEQLACPVITKMIQDQAAAELEADGNAEAAAAVRAFVLEQNEPSLAGSGYLADFEPSFVGDDGATHINTPSLQVDFASWWSYVLPEKFIGQTYCHLATATYMKALATGDMEPGIVMTTADDAPVTPSE